VNANVIMQLWGYLVAQKQLQLITVALLLTH